jgi:hypothetical protein
MASTIIKNTTLATNNINRFISSILAWVNAAIGVGDFPRYQLYFPEDLDYVSDTCKTTLS